MLACTVPFSSAPSVSCTLSTATRSNFFVCCCICGCNWRMVEKEKVFRKLGHQGSDCRPMITVWRQLWLLSWKSYVVKKKQKIWVALEIAVPICLFVLLVLIRTRNFDVISDTCHYDAKSFPSAGILPFFHSLFCSLSNNCQSAPTTGDDSYDINQGSRHESLVVQFARWLVAVLQIVGENPTKWTGIIEDVALVVHEIADLNVDALPPVALPIALFFTSRQEMVHRLQTDLGITRSRAELFNNISVKPDFFVHIANIYRNSQLQTSKLDLFETLFEFEEVEFFCNETLVAQFFFSPADEIRKARLCDISYFDLLPFLFSISNTKSSGVFSRILEHSLNDLTQLSNVNLTETAQKRIKNSFKTILDELPPFDFRPLFGSNEELLNAIFCGSLMDSITHQSGEHKGHINELLKEITANVQNFVAKLSPGRSHSDHGVEKCGDIVVRKEYFSMFGGGGSSSSSNTMEIALNGYILVSPDAPLTRALVERLNGPLRQLNYLHDLFSDYLQAADRLQDVVAMSDLEKAATVLLRWIPVAPVNVSQSIKYALQHLFRNSSDPDALLEQGKRLAESVLNVTRIFRFDRFYLLPNETELETMALCLSNYDMYLSAIVFPDDMSNSSTPADYTEYKIRHHPGLVDDTIAIMDHIWHNRARDNPYMDLKYLTFGFSFLQEAVERALVTMSTNSSIEVGLYSQQEPYPCVLQDTFNVTNFLSLFLILSWMIPAALLVKNIVWEKEMRLKEMMRIMGLGDGVHWVAWAFQCFLFNFIAIVIITCLLKFGRILPTVDFSLLFVFLIVFAVACISQCLFFTTLFSRSIVATAVTAIMFVLLFVPYWLSFKQKSPLFTTFTLVFPQTAVGYGIMMIASAEAGGFAKWHNIADIQLSDFRIDLFKIMTALSVDAVIYVLLTWYISAVFPGQYGVARPWLFFLQKSYWCPVKAALEAQANDPDSFSETSDRTFETDPRQPMSVEIEHLEKIYDNGTKAVDKLSLRFFENQITAFLGHNGAGKTTTISILTGLYPPTHGTARIYGKDIRTEISEIRDFLGFCPQHNVLFDVMTVEEQLSFYGSLKGIPCDSLQEELDVILRDIGLEGKRKALSSSLSGGMKRKLCIGIALIGGSKLVILDEPTAGVDAYARRSIWDLLLKHKQGRTMILSTHHMDEADVLSDRIAIIAEGQLRTVGSSLFLKKTFGHGYRLTIARSFDPLAGLPPAYSETPEEADPIVQRQRLDTFVSSYTRRQGHRIDESDTELVYQLPLSMSADDLKTFFEQLDQTKERFGIRSYGLSAPTLQQIFIQIAPSHVGELKKHQSCVARYLQTFVAWISGNRFGQVLDESLTNLVQESAPERDQAHPPVQFVDSKYALLRQHARALFIKRLHNFKRSLWLAFFTLICPILLLLISELYPRFQSKLRSDSFVIDNEPLYLTQLLYGNYTEVYFGIWNRNHTSTDYLETMMAFPGIGCRCITTTDLYNDTLDRCLEDYATGKLDLDAVEPEHTPYNVPQECGCSPSTGWNCTNGDYPIQKLPHFTLNTSDTVWDLSYRNISQFRLVTYKNTTQRPPMLGGFTFGHENVQAMTPFEIVDTATGFDTLIGAFGKAFDTWNLEWRKAVRNISWTSANDTFNVPGMTPRTLFVEALPYFDSTENNKIWFNNKAYASLPINTNAYHNAVLRAKRTEVNPDELGIMTISHPMNQSASAAVDDSYTLQSTIMFRIVTSVLVMSFVPAACVLLLVEERSSFSRHLQGVFGVAPWMYWLINFVFDYIIIMIVSMLVIIVYLAIGIDVFTFTWDAIISTICLFVLYNATTLPMVYLLQMLFGTPSVAYALVGIGLFFVGVVTSMTINLFENLTSADDGLVLAHQVCSVVFLLVPQYNLGIAISRLNFVYGIRETAATYLRTIGRADMISSIPLPAVSQWELMGKHFVALIVNGILFLLLLALVEYRDVCFRFLMKLERRRTKVLLEKSEESLEHLDDDVKREHTFVASINELDEFGLVVRQLAKAYDKDFLAVNNLSFAVRKGEVFGLLGVNGAGKTTTFSMLTGRLPIGHGEVFVHGNSVVDGGFASMRLLGYCPQFDALNMRLTAREQLAFYARIRGIQEADVSKSVDWAIRHMQLTPYAREICGSYSGGNKRKLSAAIALIADPPVVLLDEPSAGMDVSSQQFMWNLIVHLRKSHRSIVITSHSMEECEALCSRAAIMAAGQLQCFGSVQHLKNRFGQGYSLTLRLRDPEQADQATLFLQQRLPSAVLQSQHCSTLFFRIPSQSDAPPIVASAFAAIDDLRSLMPLDDFALSQTTLDDVFVSFAQRISSERGDLDTFDDIALPAAVEEAATTSD